MRARRWPRLAPSRRRARPARRARWPNELGRRGDHAGDFALGDYDDRLLFLEPRHLFPENIEEGMGFEGLPEGCNASAPRDRLYFVSDIYPDHVVMDGNHPLAGIALRIKLKVHAVREATVSEIGKGSLGTGFFSMQVDGDEGDGEPTPSRPTLH